MTTINGVNGVATFTNVSIDKAGVGYTLDASTTTLTSATSAPFNVTPAPASCLAYGVQDSSSANSQFFTLDPVTKVTSNIGPLYTNWDFEALDIDPTTGLVYAATSSGNAFNKKGYVYIVDGISGSLTLVGPSGQKNIEGLAFRPTDSTLWGWASGKGIVTINKTTGAATLVKSNSRHAEALAWNNNGTLLYFAEGRALYSYNPAKGTIITVTKAMPGPVEALDMRTDGLLAVGVDGKSTLYAYNPVTNKFISSKYITGLPYKDIEGISWPVCAP
jgi:DNA-binding beta-propeller fold protein YncE